MNITAVSCRGELRIASLLGILPVFFYFPFYNRENLALLSHFRVCFFLLHGGGQFGGLGTNFFILVDQSCRFVWYCESVVGFF